VKLNDAFKNKTVTKKDLKDELKLTSSQLDEWLKMGVENEYLIKKVRPVTFMINPEITIRLLFN
jgi:phage-related minor tail protein